MQGVVQNGREVHARWVQGGPAAQGLPRSSRWVTAGWVHPWALGATAPGGESAGGNRRRPGMNQPRCSETFLAPPARPRSSPRSAAGTPQPLLKALDAPCASHSASPSLAGSRDRGDRTEVGKEIFLHYPPLLARADGKAAVGPWPRGDGSTCGTCRGDIKAVTASLPPPRCGFCRFD